MANRQRRTLADILTDYPSVVTVAIVALAALQLLVSLKLPYLNVAHALATSDVEDVRSALSSLALGVAGVSALVGGFAGVVVVFGLVRRMIASVSSARKAVGDSVPAGSRLCSVRSRVRSERSSPQ